MTGDYMRSKSILFELLLCLLLLVLSLSIARRF